MMNPVTKLLKAPYALPIQKATYNRGRIIRVRDYIPYFSSKNRDSFAFAAFWMHSTVEFLADRELFCAARVIVEI